VDTLRLGCCCAFPRRCGGPGGVPARHSVPAGRGYCQVSTCHADSQRISDALIPRYHRSGLPLPKGTTVSLPDWGATRPRPTGRSTSNVQRPRPKAIHCYNIPELYCRSGDLRQPEHFRNALSTSLITRPHWNGTLRAIKKIWGSWFKI
jgi:hypothetical protein